MGVMLVIFSIMELGGHFSRKIFLRSLPSLVDVVVLVAGCNGETSSTLVDVVVLVAGRNGETSILADVVVLVADRNVETSTDFQNTCLLTCTINITINTEIKSIHV